MLTFSINRATQTQLYQHLLKVDNDFTPPLHEVTDIKQFAEKVADKAITLEYFDGNNLVALYTTYLNVEQGCIWATNLSIIKEYRGTGLFHEFHNRLVRFFSEMYAEQYGVYYIRAAVKNWNLLPKYFKIGFREYKRENNLAYIECEI